MLAFRVDGRVRQLDFSVRGRDQITPAKLDAEQHRRVRRRALERRGEDLHPEAADRNRALQGVDHLRGQVGLRLYWRLARRVGIASPGSDGQPWTRNADVDVVELAVAFRVRRI